MSDIKQAVKETKHQNEQPITIVVQSVLDGRVIGESVTKYQNNRARATG